MLHEKKLVVVSKTKKRDTKLFFPLGYIFQTFVLN